MRNKRCAAPGKPTRRGPVIFIHGATYPGSVMCDSPMFGGGSWLDDIAQGGFDAWVFDIRGYGRSTRPAPERDHTGREQPIARTADAICDLQAVVGFVCGQSGASQVDLIGWSWGANIAGGFAAEEAGRVRRLVLLGPVWVNPSDPATLMSRFLMSATPFMNFGVQDFLGTYRSVTRQYARERWARGLDRERAEQLLPMAEFERWWNSIAALDPEGRGPPPHVVRAPNGVLADGSDYWAVGKPTYRPQDITAPTLVLVAEWDVDTPIPMVLALYSQLESAAYKRLEVLRGGTHCIALELNRAEVFARTREFLSAAQP
ncbi:MAG: alpha/beta hydrolase [Burkholderiales bacterium]